MQKNRHHAHPSESGISLAFRFTLTYEEIREAFLMIIDRRSRTSRLAMNISLFLLALVCVCLYALYPQGLQFALMACLFAFFSFLVCVYPSWKAGRAARIVVKKGGTYKFSLSSEGYFILPGGEKLLLKGDSRSRAFETDTLFAVRPDRYHTICLPKRVIRTSDLIQVRSILQSNIRAFHDRTSSVKTGTAQL